MADERWIWWEVENEDEVMLKLTASTKRLRRRTRDLLNELAEDGVVILNANVPNYEGYTLKHVDRSSVSWRPGGAGGGGEYEATVGIKSGTSYHPVYANRGTGEFGPFIKKPYTSLNGRMMWFHASRAGKRIGVWEVRGQRAQHFLYITYRELQVFAQARVHTGSF